MDGWSLEHLVTEGLWSDPAVKVVGLPWCREQAAIVGLASLGATILCRRHNSALSPVDTAGIIAQRAISGFYATTQAHAPHAVTFDVDGNLLERWLLKTLINLVVSSSPTTHWHGSSSGHREPPDHLVRIAFGRAVANAVRAGRPERGAGEQGEGAGLSAPGHSEGESIVQGSESLTRPTSDCSRRPPTSHSPDGTLPQRRGGARSVPRHYAWHG